jgi:hypothetical protein
MAMLSDVFLFSVTVQQRACLGRRVELRRLAAVVLDVVPNDPNLTRRCVSSGLEGRCGGCVPPDAVRQKIAGLKYGVVDIPECKFIRAVCSPIDAAVSSADAISGTSDPLRAVIRTAVVPSPISVTSRRCSRNC